MMSDGAQRSICCSSLKTNKKQILRSAQDDMLGGLFSSLLVKGHEAVISGEERKLQAVGDSKLVEDTR